MVIIYLPPKNILKISFELAILAKESSLKTKNKPEIRGKTINHQINSISWARRMGVRNGRVEWARGTGAQNGRAYLLDLGDVVEGHPALRHHGLLGHVEVEHVQTVIGSFHFANL